MTQKLEDLKLEEKLLLEKLEDKRKQIGKSDGPMESRYPTGRFELENLIELLEIQLQDVRVQIKQILQKADCSQI